MSKTTKILIVDDDPKALSVLSDMLSTDPDKIVVALSDSAEAIDSIGDTHFDLVITDLMMPGPDGIDIIRQTKEFHPDSLIIVITGCSSFDLARSAIEAGAHTYITKPFQTDELLMHVENACQRLKLQQENRALRARLDRLEASAESDPRNPSSSPELMPSGNDAQAQEVFSASRRDHRSGDREY